MRREFPRAVRVAVIKRCTRDNQIWCEGCGLSCKRFEIDHIRADGLLGDNTIENAQLLCKGTPESCHDKKTKGDRAAIDQAKRREAAHIGARPAPVQKIKSKGFDPSERTLKNASRDKLPMPPRRDIFSREIVE